MLEFELERLLEIVTGLVMELLLVEGLVLKWESESVR